MSVPCNVASSTPHQVIRVKDFLSREDAYPLRVWRLPSQETPQTAAASGTDGMTVLPAYTFPDTQFCDTRRRAGTDAEDHNAGET
jgi:hypothetical protein